MAIGYWNLSAAADWNLAFVWLLEFGIYLEFGGLEFGICFSLGLTVPHGCAIL
jgi:hypothetical protein